MIRTNIHTLYQRLLNLKINLGEIMNKIPFYKANNLILSKDDDKFYEGDTLLKKDESGGTGYSSDDFDQLIRGVVSEFIDQSFDHIVFLVGAGGSVVMRDEELDPNYGKTVAMLSITVFSQLREQSFRFPNDKEDKEVFSIPEMSEAIRYGEITNKDGDLLVDGKPFNFEDFLSKLLTYIEFVDINEKAKWEDSRRAIYTIIERETSYNYDSMKLKHAAVLNTLSKKLSSENKLCVVTTNYDTLLEDAADKQGYTVFDGFSFSRIPKFDDDMFEWHLSKHVSNVKTRENIYKDQVIDLLKIHGSLTWRRSEDGESVIRLAKGTEGEPVMIFPSSSKYMQSYQQPYFELFSRFQELLKQPNTLLITSGFSFADDHISRMIIQAITHNPSLFTLISDYSINPEKPNNNWQKLMSMQDETYSIAFLKATLNDNLAFYMGGQ